MMNQFRKTKNLLFTFLPYLVFFLISFIFFGLFADYVCFFQEKSTLFIFSGDYLTEHLHQPGSLLLSISKFLSAFFYLPAAGAAIVSATICLIIYLVSKIMTRISGAESIFIPMIAGAAFFFLHTDYQYLFYNSLGLLFQLALFSLAIKYLKGWLPVVLFPLWYFITGGFAWIFYIMYILYLAFNAGKRGWFKIAALTGLVVLMICLFKEFVFFRTLKSLLTFPYTGNNLGSQFRLFVPVAVFIASLPVIAKVRLRFPSSLRINETILKSAAAIVPIVLLILLAILRNDSRTRQYFRVEKLFYHGRYNDVIAFNTKNPSNNILTNYLNNIALCETGKLNDMLFHFRQSPDGQTLFLKWEMLGEILKRGGYFYYTTGMINEAQRWAYENIVMKGHSPEGLKMLIRTELINGNYPIAAKYIRILKKTIFYRSEAKVFEKLLFDDQAIITHPELGVKRKEKIEHDFFSITDDPLINIERVLASDSLNRKAFEYKMAFLLLNKDYSAIIAEIPKLENYGFNKIPVHLDEALVAYKTLKLGPLPDVAMLQSDSQTELRFSQFLQTFQLYGNRLQTAEPALRQKFGKTFWYWAFYR